MIKNFRQKKREILENFFFLIFNDIFHKELTLIYCTQYGYYLQLYIHYIWTTQSRLSDYTFTFVTIFNITVVKIIVPTKQ